MRNTKSASTRTLYLDVARAFAIISITCNHAVNRSYNNYSNQAREFEAYSLIANMLKAFVTVFSHLGVPIFLMITGTLLLNKRMDQPDQLKRYYKHNVLGLLITTEIWYLIMYWFIILLNPANNLLETKGIVHVLKKMILNAGFQNQVTLGSMWYMPMILCIYTTIPIAIAAKEKLPAWVLCIPLGLVFVNNMLIPAFNGFQKLTDGSFTLKSSLSQANICSHYYLYIFAGYYVSKGVLKNRKDWQVGLLALATFLLCCGYQLFAYSRPANYLIGYSSPALLVCAFFLFDWIKRKAAHLERFRFGITYLSRIAFGIYFVRIIIMELICWNVEPVLRPSLRMVALEVVSFVGSIPIIWLLSKIPVCKKYLFMIKD